jgi:acetoacetyl-CoA synthetase
VTERFPQVQDAICIGQRRATDLDETVILFLKLNRDVKLTPQLTAQIKGAIKEALSARHVPKYVFEVQDIPYT